MLIDAKPKLTADIWKLAFAAAQKAMMTTSISSDADPDIRARMKADIAEASTQWATTFADSFAEPMAQAIYEFVLRIGITQTPIGLVSTSIDTPSPVGGTCPPAGFKIT